MGVLAFGVSVCWRFNHQSIFFILMSSVRVTLCCDSICDNLIKYCVLEGLDISDVCHGIQAKYQTSRTRGGGANF
jgi:hypothetical protein